MLLMKAIQRAIDILGLAGIANLYSPPITPQAVHKWNVVPAERCPAIEKATGGKVRCEDLRPDVDWQYLRGTKKAA